jgi:SAM-dependent methyltransferase
MSKQAEREYALKVDQAFLYDKPFHDPRVFREFAFVLEVFRQHCPDGKILDLGCGPGWTSLFLARAGFDVLGVDISERMIEVARERGVAENNPARFQVADMEELDLEERDFDGALFFDCLHHCPQYGEVLRRACEHLRPGGAVLLLETTLLHRYSPHARAESRHYGITELGFSRRQLRRALTAAGFLAPRFFHDPGPVYRGAGGLLHSSCRLWCDYFFYFPRAKNIALAQKPR